MKRSMLLLGVTLLLGGALRASTAPINACEIRGVIKDIHELSGFGVLSVDIEDGSEVIPVNCQGAPLAWTGSAYVVPCASNYISNGDCVHAMGRLTPNGCRATLLFVKLPAVYCP